MKITPWTKFYVEFEDDGGGGAPIDDNSSLYDDDIYEESGDPGEPSGGGQQQAPNFTFEQVQQLMQASGARQSPQTPQRPQFTQEQIDGILKKPKVNKDLVDAMLGPQEDDAAYERAQKGLQLFADMMSSHVLATSQHASQYALHNVNQQFAPLLSQQEQQVNKSFTNEIVQRFGSLQGKQQVIDIAVNFLKTQGFQPRSQQEAVVKTAEVAARILKQADPSFRLGPRPNGGNGGMNGFSRPSGGGGGNSRQSGGSTPEWKKAFGFGK